jgi:hypothetical protein
MALLESMRVLRRRPAPMRRASESFMAVDASMSQPARPRISSWPEGTQQTHTSKSARTRLDCSDLAW